MRMQSTWPQRPLAHVVGGIDLSAEAAEGEQLVTGTPNLAEQFTAQRTIGYAGQDGIEIAFELTLTVFSPWIRPIRRCYERGRRHDQARTGAACLSDHCHFRRQSGPVDFH